MIYFLGELRQMDIWHDRTGDNPDWFLDYVEINDKKINKNYKVNCYTWIENGIKTYFL